MIVPEFYDAKRLALTADAAGGDRRPNAGTIVNILLAIGYPEPERCTSDDGKALRVWLVNAYDLMSNEERDLHRAERAHRFAGEPYVIHGYTTGTSMADVARRVVPSYVRSKRTQGMSEMPTTDYRYYLAGINPGSVIVPGGDQEFSDHGPLILTPEQIQERRR